MGYTMKTNLANRSNYGEKRDVKNIKFIVLHYTGNDGDKDENNGNYFKNNITYTSAHYFVDSDSITQTVPDDYVAYAVGDAKYPNTKGAKYHGKCTNANSISVELCDDILNGVIYPSAKTIQNAIELVKKLMKKHNIPQSNVIRHYDVSGKSCPAYWVDDVKWKKEFWDGLTEPKKESASTSKKVTYYVFAGAYKVKANADVQLSKVKKTGFKASIVKVDNLYKVQVSSHAKKTDADAQVKKLKSKGFDAYILTTTGTAVEPSKTIKVGSTVKLKNGAKTYDGGSLASFVYGWEMEVMEIINERVVLTHNGSIIAAVRKSDLTLVK